MRHNKTIDIMGNIIDSPPEVCETGTSETLPPGQGQGEGQEKEESSQGGGEYFASGQEEEEAQTEDRLHRDFPV